MKKYFFLLTLASVVLIPFSVSAANWKPTTPDGFTPITWISGNGIASFIDPPQNNGYIDYLTIINLQTVQIKALTSSTPRTVTGPAASPFPTDVESTQNWLFPRSTAEAVKAAHPEVKFLWDITFFEMTRPSASNLSMGLKSSDQNGAYITSGYRMPSDMDRDRRMLIIDNEKGTANILPFDETIFVKEGDQALEGFGPLSTPTENDSAAARLFIGVREAGTELVIYCSKGATLTEASNALLSAGVPMENQLQADGGGSATCGYNLPGQYFVEPGRTLPTLMGAIPVSPKGTATIDKLNVRSGPGTTNKSVRQLPLNTLVTIYEEKNGWLRISENNEWVSAQYIKKVRTLPYSAAVTIDQLNVRSGAGTTFKATRKLAIGATVQVLEEKNGWVRISPTEWISAQYIK